MSPELQDMSDQPIALSLEAIQEDLDALASWKKSERTLVQSYPLRLESGGSGSTTRGPSGGQEGVGRRMLRRWGPDAEQRLLTLLHLEFLLAPEHDYAVLIACAGQLVESVLVRLIAEQLRPRARRLIEALQVHSKDASAAEVLARWSEGRQPTTLGTIVNLLLALRRAEELDLADLRALIRQQFTGRFIELLRGNHLAQALNTVRDRYRNPAAHGLRTFNVQEYEAFSRLVVAQARFQDWDQWGPHPSDPPAHEAVFHHHLAGYRWPGPPTLPPNPLDRLLALRTPSGSAVRVEVSVKPKGASRTREVGLGGEEMSPTFHLGMPIAITLQAEPDAYGLLLDVGTSGTVAMLWPNRWDSRGRLKTGQPVHLPGPCCPHPFVLQGALGVERLLVLAGLDPWPCAGWEKTREAFVKLNPDDLDCLVTQVLERDPARWAVGCTAFSIVA